MKRDQVNLVAVLVLLASACTAKTADGSSSETENAPTPLIKQDAPAVAYDQAKKAIVETPSPSSVLYFIFQMDGDGASTYEVENGSWVSYWYGHQFEFGGKQYFTGFAYQTPEKYGKSDDENYAGPGSKVTITHATYILTHPGTDRPWTFEGAQRFVGEFGGYEKANEVDDTRKPIEYRTRDNRMVLAIPTWYLASGTQVDSCELFLFDPKEILKIEDVRWAYLGNVETGSDNGAACDEQDGGKIRCVKHKGELTFVADQDAGLPLVRVTTSSTGMAARGVDETSVVEYRYDASKKQYRQQ